MNTVRHHHEVRLRQNVKSQYVFKERLGSGTHGVVHLAVERSTGILRAVKKIRKKAGLDIDRFKRELEVLLNFRHPQIVKVYEAFEDNHALYIIMEYCQGGDLCDRLELEGSLPESVAAYFMRQALGAISMCHENGIMHRDVKLENFLLSNQDARSPLKLTDFGLCRYTNDMSDPPSLVGTINYLAPEVLGLKYDNTADLWSLGVLLYMLLLDRFPFGRHAQCETDVLREIKKGVIEFDDSCSKSRARTPVPSLCAQDLIRRLCRVDPSARISAKDALKHPWITALSPSPFQYLPVLLSNIPTTNCGIQPALAPKMEADEAADVEKLDATFNEAQTTVQQFLQLMQAEDQRTAVVVTTPPPKEGSLTECSKWPQITGGSHNSIRSSPSLTVSQVQCLGAPHQNESTTSSSSSTSLKPSDHTFEVTSLPRWSSTASLNNGLDGPHALEEFRSFCCDLIELGPRHSKRCPRMVEHSPEDNSKVKPRCACLFCAAMNRSLTSMKRIGIHSYQSAANLGKRLVERWKAFQYLTSTEKHVLSTVARQMDTSELTYFGCLYEFLDYERTGNAEIENLARAVGYLCHCDNLVCHIVAPDPFEEFDQNCCSSVCAESSTHVHTPVSNVTPPKMVSQSLLSPASLSTTVPKSAEGSSSPHPRKCEIRNISYVTDRLKICEECTPAASFSAYQELVAELRILLRDHMDLNANGKIEVDEFCAACMDHLLVLKPVASKILFKSINVNQTTRITVDEFVDAFGQGSRDGSLLNSVDPDGDGLIEESDLEALLSESAACLSRGSRTRLCEECENDSVVLVGRKPRDAMDFRHLLPK